MIRRHVDHEFWLFTQHDHALLSGKLAEQFGNDRYARPEPEGDEKRSETDDEPLFEVERLKQNFLCQFESLAEWLEDLDLRFATVHATI